MYITAGGLLSLCLILCVTLIHETRAGAAPYTAYPVLNRSQVVGYNSLSTDITLGSNLSTNTAGACWLSPSGRFSFGFYSKREEILLGINLIINPVSSMVVWTARLDLNPFSKYATLIFTAEGFLLIPNRGPSLPFFLYNFSSPASAAAMLDNGNFVVYGSNSSAVSQISAVSLNKSKPISYNRACSVYTRCRQGLYDRGANSTNVIWRSFNYPTDTILGSQSLPCGKNLTSAAFSASAGGGGGGGNNNPSIQAQVLSMQCDGNLVLYTVNSSSAIWASVTSGYYYRSLDLDENGRLYLSNVLGSDKDISGYKPQIGQTDMIYAARLDADNIFRLYAINLSTNTSNVVNDIPYYKDLCYDPEMCGVNSFCLLVDDAPKCKCAPGFTYIQPSAPTAGCRRSGVLPKCKLAGGAAAATAATVSMETVEHVVGMDELAYLIVSTTTGDECSRNCLEDCDCYAAVYRDQQCSKLKLPLSGGRYAGKDPGVAYVKLAVEEAGFTGINITKREFRTVAVTVSASVSGVICLAVIAACGGAYWLLFGRFREQWEKWELAFTEEIAPRYFDYNELLCNPSAYRTELGRGAHGTVFKVKLPMGGVSVAVKMLHGTEGDAEKDFRTEMSLIGRARHANLVRLLGFCHDGPSRLLVYEYMCRNSLAKCIFESTVKDRLGWARRVGLLLGAARGIHYLHCECETKIIHRDIKPENILISEDWTAKISDFGLAKLVIATQTNAATMTAAVGTAGYIAPECQRGDETSGTVLFTEKADVYSYGVVVLETITGRRNGDGDLRDLARKCCDTGEIGKLVGGEVVAVESNVDRAVKIGNEEAIKESDIERVVKIGILCVQENPEDRPSMEDVVMMLEGDMDVPNLPPLPSPEK